MSATDLNRKALIIKWRVILLQFCPFWVSKENDLIHCNPTVTCWRALGDSTLSFMKETRSSSYELAVCELTSQDMWYLTSTIPEVEFLRSPIHLQWIHVFHCIHNSHHCRHYEIATCNIKIIMRLEENHTFLFIETPRSVLFFNYVASTFACPTKDSCLMKACPWRIQWIQVSSCWNASPCRHMKSTVFSPKLERDLWRMVVIFKFNKILA